MAVAAILDFQKVEIVTVDPLPGDKMRHLAKFYQNRSKGCRDMPVFSKWRPSTVTDFLSAYWDHPRRPLVGLYRCTKFG